MGADDGHGAGIDAAADDGQLDAAYDLVPMVAKWIAGAENLVDERIAYAQANGLSARVGGTYKVPDAPWRFVFHTTNIGAVGDTDGWTVAQCRQNAIEHRNPPHLWAAPWLGWVGQTVPLDLSAYALRHERGDPETNHAHAIQVEVYGYAEREPLRDPGLGDWLGRHVLGPVLAAGVPINLGHLAPSDDSDAYGLNGSVRHSWGWWASFDGICGHQNVPGNEHWDPGISDYAGIAQSAQPHPPVPEEDDPRVFYVKNRDKPDLGVYKVNTWTWRKRHVASAEGAILLSAERLLEAGEGSNPENPLLLTGAQFDGIPDA